MFTRIILLLPTLIFSGSPRLGSTLIADGFTKPVYVCQPTGEKNRLFVLEQKGVIKLINDGKTYPKPFADLRDRVHNPLMPGDERGLLGLAFHPNYPSNGFIYLNYVNKNDETIVSRFTVSDNPNELNPDSEKILIKLKQPFSNHNGGHLEFGPDGYLYISVGDGGSAGDPYNAGQSLNTLFGKILRIDVDSKFPYSIPPSNPFIHTEGARGEIWAWGLRNVWRFSFDRETGDLYMGDVGQNKWEEINVQSASSVGGENYGWRIMEGNHCYNPPEDCDVEGLKMPVFEYPNDANYMRTLTGRDQPDVDGCSVTGGYVYRGNSIPDLYGAYIFGDYCSGNIWTFRVVKGRAVDIQNRTEAVNLGGGSFTHYISSFGQDGDGEIYIVDYNGGIYKLVTVD